MSDQQQTQSVVALARDGTRHSCTISFTAAPPWTVTLEGLDGGTVRAVGDDLFDALAHLRVKMEPLGVALLLQGARRDVLPSPMLRQAGGRFAYTLRMGQQARPQDRVDIFAPIVENLGVPVDEQRAFALEWIASLGSPAEARR